MNRAKLILIKMRGMTEAEAHRFIVHSRDGPLRQRSARSPREIIDYHEKYEEKRGTDQYATGNGHRT